MQRFLRVRNGQRFLGPTSGAMGYAVPAAIAAKVEAPRRMAVACVGDGGFGMTGQEFATAALCGVAPIVVVFNNRMYGTIRMHQERRYPERVMATALANPDFAALARAYGGHGETVRRTAEFGPAFDRAVASGKPAIVEMVTDQQQITSRATVAYLRAAAKR